MGLTVIGMPRSGTTFTAKLLQNLGLDVGHERLGKDGIVSWQVSMNMVERSPWGDGTRRRDIPKENKVVHVVRHPLKVIASLGTEAPHGPSAKFMQACMLGVKAPDPGTDFSLPARMLLWYCWVQHCMRQTDRTIRIDDMVVEAPKLVAELGRPVPETYEVPPSNMNTRPHEPLTWEELHKADLVMAWRIHALTEHLQFEQ